MLYGYECRVHYSNNKTKQPIYAMDLHTGCANKNVPVQFLDHLTVIKPLDHHRLVDYQIVLNYRTIFPFRKSFG